MLVMNVLEYVSGFDFVDMMQEFDYEYVKFMGGRANGTYMLGIDDDARHHNSNEYDPSEGTHD